MDNLDYLGEIELPKKQIKSQIMINVIEGRDYYKSHIDTYVVVEVPLCFRGKTATGKASTSPSYFKTFIIDLPPSLLNSILNMYITITVYESRNILSLPKTVILGSTVIQVSTIWSEPDGPPCIGPAFLHFTTLESQQYFGRVLFSVDTELVPSEVENVKRLQIEDIDSILDEDLKYIPIVIIGVILCVNQVHKDLISSKNMAITMEYSEYNLVTESVNKQELINTKTPEYKVVKLDNDFYKLLIEEDRKPFLFLVTNIPSIEYYAMFSMNLLSKTISIW
ncbi:uncharacterized protein LOC114121205 [Aphis gossypii]|uniref:uncharacterized protein LOC114121205 n=1 Tax=Aphis gossypii TaxID=80765 RepID=UPI0021594860|nr:uncharacterized protein LOC114121205 [Aphis gossypii]